MNPNPTPAPSHPQPDDGALAAAEAARKDWFNSPNYRFQNKDEAFNFAFAAGWTARGEEVEATILRLTSETTAAQKSAKESKDELLRAAMVLHRLGVPSGFEDGNSWDDYSFDERMNIFGKMHVAATARLAEVEATLEQQRASGQREYSELETTSRIEWERQEKVITTLTHRLALARKAIEDAPHDSDCDIYPFAVTDGPTDPAVCTCWKSKVPLPLAGDGQAKEGDWLPIADAQRDGNWVEARFSVSAMKDRELRWDGEVWRDRDGFEYDPKYHHQPTHYRPLPSPKAGEGKSL